MSNETPPHCDVWETTLRMQALTAKRRSETAPKTARPTPPRARAPEQPAIESPLQYDLPVHTDNGLFA